MELEAVDIEYLRTRQWNILPLGSYGYLIRPPTEPGCPICGKPLPASTLKPFKYCSMACRQKAYRNRKRKESNKAQ